MVVVVVVIVVVVGVEYAVSLLVIVVAHNRCFGDGSGSCVSGQRTLLRSDVSPGPCQKKNRETVAIEVEADANMGVEVESRSS